MCAQLGTAAVKWHFKEPACSPLLLGGNLCLYPFVILGRLQVPVCMLLARTAQICLLELHPFLQAIGKAKTILLKHGKCGSENDAIILDRGRKGNVVSYSM